MRNWVNSFSSWLLLIPGETVVVWWEGRFSLLVASVPVRVQGSFHRKESRPPRPRLLHLHFLLQWAGIHAYVPHTPKVGIHATGAGKDVHFCWGHDGLHSGSSYAETQGRARGSGGHFRDLHYDSRIHPDWILHGTLYALCRTLLLLTR